MTARLMTEAERRRASGEKAFVAGPYSRDLAQKLATGSICRLFGAETYENDCVAALLRASVLQTLLVTFSPPWSES